MRKTILAFVLLFATQAFSQTISPFTLNVGGGSKAIQPNFIVDWSIGESTSVDTYLLNAPSRGLNLGRYWYVTSGVLQPFDNTHIIVTPLVPYWTAYEIRFYPVPTSNIVTIDLRTVTTGKISIQLLDMNSKMLELKEFYYTSSNGKYTWDLSRQSSGVYFLKVVLTSAQGKILKQGTFKIEKIN